MNQNSKARLGVALAKAGAFPPGQVGRFLLWIDEDRPKEFGVIYHSIVAVEEDYSKDHPFYNAAKLAFENGAIGIDVYGGQGYGLELTDLTTGKTEVISVPLFCRNCGVSMQVMSSTPYGGEVCSKSCAKELNLKMSHVVLCEPYISSQ